MAVASVLRTAFSGISAAQNAIGVIADNLANARTPGFKQSSVEFATQPLQTHSHGAGPQDGHGGTNPMQTGLGVLAAGVSTDFSQGTIQITDLGRNLVALGQSKRHFEANPFVFLSMDELLGKTIDLLSG
jgi:flagellar hook protein FlgE